MTVSVMDCFAKQLEGATLPCLLYYGEYVPQGPSVDDVELKIMSIASDGVPHVAHQYKFVRWLGNSNIPLLEKV
jgi:hypothetical protein